MLSSTVYQGKRAGSWKTTARLGSGPSTGAPFAHTWPRVGRSKPATMLRSVDLPQPEGPRIAANSFGATAKSIACTASTRRPRLTNSFQTSRSSAARRGSARGRSAMRLERAPPEEQVPGAQDDPVGDEAQETHREHRRHADVHPPHVIRVPEDVAEPRLHREHLGHDHRPPRPPPARDAPTEVRPARPR